MLYWDGVRWWPHQRPAFGTGAQAPSGAAAIPPQSRRSPHQLVRGMDNALLAGVVAVVALAAIIFVAFILWAHPAGFDESYDAGFASGQDGAARTTFERTRNAATSCEAAWDAEKKFLTFHAYSRMSYTEGCGDALGGKRPTPPPERPI